MPTVVFEAPVATRLPLLATSIPAVRLPAAPQAPQSPLSDSPVSRSSSRGNALPPRVICPFSPGVWSPVIEDAGTTSPCCRTSSRRRYPVGAERSCRTKPRVFFTFSSLGNPGGEPKMPRRLFLGHLITENCLHETTGDRVRQEIYWGDKV